MSARQTGLGHDAAGKLLSAQVTDSLAGVFGEDKSGGKK